ncbi:hypothetical protein L1049_023802 [Liquidambar formosana]|uniref:Uncharacterized protein n=1 Tax=Liquidambar formosana TaxID=63359 RepID=A0AAP0RZ57_LIQFO
MKHRLIILLCLSLIIVGISGSIADAPNSEALELSYPSPYGENFKRSNRPAGRTLSSTASTHDTALVAAPDGTIHLVESNFKKVLWSFTSGPSIYSSYQAPVNQDNDKENASGLSSGFFIECGDDWALYAHTEPHGKMKLSMTVEDFVSKAPYISEDGGVTLGSKKTTVFLVDAKTGS